MIQGWDSWWIAGGKNTTVQDDLKYFRIRYDGNRNITGSNIEMLQAGKIITRWVSLCPLPSVFGDGPIFGDSDPVIFDTRLIGTL